MVNTLQNFWQKHRKVILIMALLLLTILVMPHLVHAQAPAPSPSPSPAPDSSSKTLQPFLDGASTVVKFLQTLLWPVLMMIGSLMQNDILFGSGMEARLLEVWVNVRNIVNIFFVLILLGIALYNVLGAGENYHFKTILPKFVIGLIVVNFTFIGMKIVLDATNVLTTAMFALPQSVQAELAGNNPSPSGAPMVGIFKVDEANSMCGAIYGGVNMSGTPDSAAQATYNNAITAATQPGASATAAPAPLCVPYPPPSGATSLMAPATVSDFSQMTSRNSAMVMAITLGKTNLLDKVYLDPNSPDPTAPRLLTNILLSIVLYVVYGTAFIALFVALLIRLVALWVMIALSPLMVLPFVVPALKEKLGEGGDLLNKFVSNAIMPIIVGVVMSIGFVMLRGLQAATITGDKLINSPTLSLGLLTSGISTLQELIVAFGMVAFVWVGVFHAFKGTYAEGITGTIQSTVSGAAKSLGGFAVKSIPLFPTGRFDKSGKQITGNLGDVSMALHQGIPNMMRQKEDEHYKQTFPQFGGGDTKAIEGVKGAKNWKDYSQSVAGISKTSLGDANFQKNTLDRINANSEIKGKFQTAAANYSNSKGEKGYNAFIKDLQAGTVTSDAMEDILRRSGANPGSAVAGGPPPKDLKGAIAKEGISPLQNELLDPKQQGKYNLTDAQKKDLAQIKKDLADPDANKRKAAKDKLDVISDPIDKANAAKSGVDANLKFDITRNVGPDAKPENAKAIEDSIQQKIDAMAGGAAKDSKEYKDAQDQVLKMAATDLAAQSKENRDKLKSVAGNSPLLTQAIGQAEKQPAAPAKPVAPAPAPAKGKPAAPAQPPQPAAPAAPVVEGKPTSAGVVGQLSPGGQWISNGTDWIQAPKPPGPAK